MNEKKCPLRSDGKCLKDSCINYMLNHRNSEYNLTIKEETYCYKEHYCRYFNAPIFVESEV